ncbi:MAG: hypothetical protein F6K19_34455, partial [Cyanothece sp. SIO1E1]|nr:hypothetical protein [Cyanothece sp. SIO1E1]
SASEALRALQALRPAVKVATSSATPSKAVPPGAKPIVKQSVATELVTPTPPPVSPFSATLNPAFLELCQQELTRCIGPMANYLIEDILIQHPQITPRQLIAAIVAEIPDVNQARIFQQNMTAAAHGSRSAAKAFAVQTTPQQSPPPRQPPARPVTPPTLTNPHPKLSPRFIERCQQELTHYIGPVANCILADTLAQEPQLTPQQLVQLLAAEIPDLSSAQEFQRHLL